VNGFVVERYWPGVTGEDVIALHTALLAARRPDVYYIGAVLMPGDETILLCFGAADAAPVRDAALAAGLRPDRIAAAVFYGE